MDNQQICVVLELSGTLIVTLTESSFISAALLSFGSVREFRYSFAKIST